MSEYRISISDLAKQDIRNIAAYIRNDLQEPDIAKKTIEAMINAIFTLEDLPARISFVHDERLAKQQIRGLHINNYTAFFRINESLKTVEIIRVIYSRRDWSMLLP